MQINKSLIRVFIFWKLSSQFVFQIALQINVKDFTKFKYWGYDYSLI